MLSNQQEKSLPAPVGRGFFADFSMGVFPARETDKRTQKQSGGSPAVPSCGAVFCFDDIQIGILWFKKFSNFSGGHCTFCLVLTDLSVL